MPLLKQMLAALGWRTRSRHRVLGPAIPHRLVLTEASVLGLRECLAPEIQRQHEGISYLYGQTDGSTTVVIGAIRPDARTTPGSFDVSAVAMARVVRAINNAGLQLVGQAHSHPGQAFHSEGDEIGARIAYEGFVSLVVPSYGGYLPSLSGSAAYFFHDGGFIELDSNALTVIPGALS
jgi:Prokaryotic homologs of the JAB domain